MKSPDDLKVLVSVRLHTFFPGNYSCFTLTTDTIVSASSGRERSKGLGGGFGEESGITVVGVVSTTSKNSETIKRDTTREPIREMFCRVKSRVGPSPPSQKGKRVCSHSPHFSVSSLHWVDPKLTFNETQGSETKITYKLRGRIAPLVVDGPCPC